MLIKDLDLNDVHLFTKVSSLGSFTKAGAYFGLPPSSVSRKIGRLEDQVGVRLLERSTRAIRLTPMGSLFLQYVQRGLEDIEMGTQVIGEATSEPRGRLRISAPVLLGRVLLGDLVVGFMTRYPKVQCILALSNRQVDLVHEDFDIAIRAGRLEESAMIAKKLGNIPMALFASATYLSQNPAPAKPEDLRDHPIFDLNPGWEKVTWLLSQGREQSRIELRPQLATSDYDTVHLAVSHGLGIAKLPLLHISKASNLHRILPQWNLPSPEVHALYPHFRSATPALRAFLDFLTRQLDQGTSLMGQVPGQALREP